MLDLRGAILQSEVERQALIQAVGSPESQLSRGVDFRGIELERKLLEAEATIENLRLPGEELPGEEPDRTQGCRVFRQALVASQRAAIDIPGEARAS
jgi:hypothetical protein